MVGKPPHPGQIFGQFALSRLQRLRMVMAKIREVFGATLSPLTFLANRVILHVFMEAKPPQIRHPLKRGGVADV
jgi:hypothetical protein